MKHWTRRDMLKTGLAASAVSASGDPGLATAAQAGSPGAGAGGDSSPAAGRERLLLDFGWRFHFGHGADPTKDFGFGAGSSGNFQKTGNFLAASSMAFDDSEWEPLDLPHDWAVELPFQNDRELASKGFHPLGRAWPATSVGWYRRVFELPASDSGKRIHIEFDGSYRDTMVVFNGYYIGRHSGGYDPFLFDLTDFASLGGRNVLLVRVDATLSDGWFYEGAGIYRHVWSDTLSGTSCGAGTAFVVNGCYPGNQPVSSAFRHLILGISQPIGKTGAAWNLQGILGGDNRFGIRQTSRALGSLSYGF